MSNTSERIKYRARRKLNYNRIQDHVKLWSRFLFCNDIKRIPANLILTEWMKKTMTLNKLRTRIFPVLLSSAISYVVVDYQHLTASCNVAYALVKTNLRPAMIAETLPKTIMVLVTIRIINRQKPEKETFLSPERVEFS